MSRDGEIFAVAVVDGELVALRWVEYTNAEILEALGLLEAEEAGEESA